MNPTRPSDREKVYNTIDGERDYQAAKHPTTPAPSLIDETNLLIEYTDKLAAALTTGAISSSPSSSPLECLREVAAIAVRAMETHGAQPRSTGATGATGPTLVRAPVVGPSAGGPPHLNAPTTAQTAHTGDQPAVQL